MSAETLVKTIEVHNVTVDGYDAQHWRESYIILRDAIVNNLGEFCHDDDAAEEGILERATELARDALLGLRDLDAIVNSASDAREAVRLLRELRELVRAGEMPNHGNLPMVDLASRSAKANG